MLNSSLAEAWKDTQALARDFRAHEQKYLSVSYQEVEVRKDFIDKFFKALGWDVDHDFQTNPYEQEVKVEPPVRANGQRRADYAFHLAPHFRAVKFFVEAKKPFGDLATADNYFQTIRYAWNSDTPLAVLTDFKEFHILDCRYKPDIETALDRWVKRYSLDDFFDQKAFAEIYWLFSREAVSDGSIEKRSAELPKPRGGAVQRGLFPGGYQRIDETFLAELDDYRLSLARSLKKLNPDLDGEILTEIVQRILDRLVFIRFLEDKGIEQQRLVEQFGTRGSCWKDFVTASKRLDGIYNGIVFKHHRVLDAPGLLVDEIEFSSICEQLTRLNSPYDFDAIPIHILGSIYERFLGNVIVTTPETADVEPKPEVRKAGGVYYTPEYVVRYIVQNTVGIQIEGKSPEQISRLRFGDIACGSGSFLLGVFELLLDYHGQYYNKNPKSARKGDCINVDGKLYLSLSKKRDILTANICGVDIDAQAVEVCQLSLYLHLLKDETPGSTHQYLLDFAQIAKLKKLLPDLSRNIVCGNSLIGHDLVRGGLFEEDERRKLNPVDLDRAFDLSSESRFDAIVGNPPYRMLQPHNTSDATLAYLRKNYDAVEFKIDIFHLFLQKATKLLAHGGRLGYIVPTTILNNVYAEGVRAHLAATCCIEQIAVARGRVFKDADVHTSILVFRKEEKKGARYKNIISTTTSFSEAFSQRPEFSSQTRQSFFSELPGRVWNILVNESNVHLIRKLMTQFQNLKDVSKINRGLITGNRGEFFSESKVDDTYVPILTGSDVHRYQVAKASEYVRFERPASAGGCWDKKVHFANHKVLVRQIADKPTAAILLSQSAVTGNIFTVMSDTLEIELFLLALINSKLAAFFWKVMFTDFKNSFPQVTIFSLSQLPIMLPTLSQKHERHLFTKLSELARTLTEIVQNLMAAKSDKDQNYFAHQKESIERQIDSLVFEIYSLSPSEVKAVESTI